MILDGILLLILILAVFRGRKTGMFRMITKLLSFLLAWVCTSLWGNHLKTFLESTSLYQSIADALSLRIAEALLTEKQSIFKTIMESSAQNATQGAAHTILDMLLSGLVFFLFLCLVRLLVEVLDRTVLHLPLVKPVNSLLGMAVSLALTLCILYILAGALGGAMLCSETAFWREQMESSYLFRGMYENNIVLNLIFRKGEVS